MGDAYLRTYAVMNNSRLSPTAHRILFRMAAVVRDEPSGPDKDDEGLYYGGWADLTICLGLGGYDRESDLPKSVENRIGKAVRELKEAGYLTVAPRHLQRGHWNRVYRLTVLGFPL